MCKFKAFPWLLVLVPFFCTMVQAQAPINWYKTTPHVVAHDRTEPVLLEVSAGAGVTQIQVGWSTGALDLEDNGVNGDKIAGDGVFSIRLSPTPWVNQLTPAKVFRPHVADIKPFKGTQKLGDYAFNAEIWTPAIPLINIEPLAADAQTSSHLVNLVRHRDTPLPDIAKRFYQLFPDAYDFINIVYTTSKFANRHHYTLKNTVLGVESSFMNASTTWGSTGQLLGVNVFPLSTYFDLGSKAFSHEVGHQWMPHWPFSSLNLGIMGFEIPNNGGGEFPFELTPAGNGNYELSPLQSEEKLMEFNDFELYQMGLLAPDQVAPYFIFQNQDQLKNMRTGGTFFGPVTTITIEEYVRQKGVRVPSHLSAPKKFRFATIIVSDQLLSAQEMAFCHYFTLRAEAKQELVASGGRSQGIRSFPFYLATRGLAEAITALDPQVLGVKEEASQGLQLKQNYPNPANQETTVAFSVPTASPVRLWLTDVFGKEVRVLYQKQASAGNHEVRFSTQTLPNGLYFIRMEAGGFAGTKKMVVRH